MSALPDVTIYMQLGRNAWKRKVIRAKIVRNVSGGSERRWKMVKKNTSHVVLTALCGVARGVGPGEYTGSGDGTH